MGVLSHKLRNSAHGGEVIAFYLHFLPGHKFLHQHHLLQSSSWTAHQRVMGHISTGYELKCSRSRRGATQQVLTYLRGLFIFWVQLYFVWRFGVAFHQSSGKSWWRRCSIQHVRIHGLFCSNFLKFYLYCTRIALQPDRSFGWYGVIVYWIIMKNKSYELTRLYWVGIQLNQFEMFEESFKLISRWKQCGFKFETKVCLKTMSK